MATATRHSVRNLSDYAKGALSLLWNCTHQNATHAIHEEEKMSPQETQPNQANYLASSISKAPGLTTNSMEDIRRHKDKFSEVVSMAKAPVRL